MSAILEPAKFDQTTIMLGSIASTGRYANALIEIDGVQWRSWLPRTAEECVKINKVAAALVLGADIEL